MTSNFVTQIIGRGRLSAEHRKPRSDHRSLPVHQLVALAAEHKRGKIKLSRVVRYFGLNPYERLQVKRFFDYITNLDVDQQEIEDLFSLAEIGFYSSAEVEKRLGLE